MRLISEIDTNTKIRTNVAVFLIVLTNHWIHDALFSKPAEIHVHGVDFTPQVAIVLTIIASSQVAETGCHVCAYKEKAFLLVPNI